MWVTTYLPNTLDLLIFLFLWSVQHTLLQARLKFTCPITRAHLTYIHKQSSYCCHIKLQISFWETTDERTKEGDCVSLCVIIVLGAINPIQNILVHRATKAPATVSWNARRNKWALGKVAPFFIFFFSVSTTQTCLSFTLYIDSRRHIHSKMSLQCSMASHLAHNTH